MTTRRRRRRRVGNGVCAIVVLVAVVVGGGCSNPLLPVLPDAIGILYLQLIAVRTRGR